MQLLCLKHQMHVRALSSNGLYTGPGTYKFPALVHGL